MESGDHGLFQTGEETSPTWLPSRQHHRISGEEVQQLGLWSEIHLFISSTFVDTHAERNVLVKKVIPSLNRKLAHHYIRIIPVDLRWGVLAEESKDCHTIQKTCLNQIDKCRTSNSKTPWFIGLRTQRYGWVQSDYMPSHGFENPDLCSWLDTWKGLQQNVSITSLECMHAAQIPEEMQCSPTVFFYERVLENPEEVEKDLKWLFDFEYVSPSVVIDDNVRFQYAVTEAANEYKADQEKLNTVLQRLPYVKYRKYSSYYTKGNARFTRKNDNGKSFGVAYVDGLQGFQQQVEEDLLESINNNFQEVDMKDITAYQLENIQHENSIRLKASSFVGRTQLLDHSLSFCKGVDKSESNVMILHGVPGCGKSGLISAISFRCLAELQQENHFVFTHVVDSCVGSNIMEKMLRRLQLNLRQYRENIGDDMQSMEIPNSAFELKKNHHAFLEESAQNHSDKVFLIIVDAVNQFHDSLQAHTMWWLPRSSGPQNINFLISTLNVENSTFENACKVYPKAQKVQLDEMSDNDLQEMVSSILARFNKKLTTTDEPYLGNQMALMLSKCRSPIYIVSACEALRRFGIFEKVSTYIKNLPNEVCELFSFLLDEWSEEYGREIVEDIAGFLYVSRDGLLENEINDLLDHKESIIKGEDGLHQYQASFSRLYDCLCSFLASGGGGYLRFFHDQLKYTVKRKYVSTHSAERKFHSWLSRFFYDVIKGQLQSVPSVEPPAYYKHALQQIVYHQLESTVPNEPLSILTQSLRNIYFVRERILNKQEYELNQEYLEAIEKSNNQGEKEVLREWAAFVQLYSLNILEFPSCCFNMAVNQSITSHVRLDTEKFLDTEFNTGYYPLTWLNAPVLSNPMMAVYSINGPKEQWYVLVDCIASSPDADICCLSNRNQVFIYDQSSGEILHQLDIEGYSLRLTSDCERLWIGDRDGFVSVWDIKTGNMIKKSTEEFGTTITWMGEADGLLIFGAGLDYISQIALFMTESFTYVKKWSTETTASCFCYHKTCKLIFSGHVNVIKSWDLSGNLLFVLSNPLPKVVWSLDAHPTKPELVSLSVFKKADPDYVISKWSIAERQCIDNFTYPIEVSQTAGSNADVCFCVRYDNTGDRILCACFHNTMKIYDANGNLQHQYSGHCSFISKISLVPESNRVLTIGADHKMILWILPPSNASITSETSISLDASLISNPYEKVEWCDFLPDGDLYVIVSSDSISVRESTSLTVKSSFESNRINSKIDQCCYSIHPSGGFFCIGNESNLYWLTLPDLKKSHLHPVGPTITAIAISPDGTKMVICGLYDVEYIQDLPMPNYMVKVFDITEIRKPTNTFTYREHENRTYTCDIHPDNIHAVTRGTHATLVWNMTTGETTYRIEIGSYYEKPLVKFSKKAERILFSDGRALRIYDMRTENTSIELHGHKKHDYETTHACFYGDETLILSAGGDGSIRIFDAISGKCVYGFFQPQAQSYKSVAVHPNGNLILAPNENGTMCILRPTAF